MPDTCKFCGEALVNEAFCPQGHYQRVRGRIGRSLDTIPPLNELRDALIELEKVQRRVTSAVDSVICEGMESRG